MGVTGSMPSAAGLERLPAGGYPRMTMSETELSVICKNCGSEVSPYVTECPYCGTACASGRRSWNAAATASRRSRRRRRRPRLPRRAPHSAAPSSAFRPYATLAAILGSAALLLVQKATGDPLGTFGGLIVPLRRRVVALLTAPFAYLDVGYLFVVAVGLAIFGTGLERRLGTAPTALLLVACGALGMLVAKRHRQRPGRHRGDRRRQRHGARRPRRLVRDPPRRSQRGDRRRLRRDRRRRRRGGPARPADLRVQRRPLRRSGRRRRRRPRRPRGLGPARSRTEPLAGRR